MAFYILFISGAVALNSVLPASAQIQRGFHEIFHFDLGEYWCENHLAVADFDRDGWNDIALIVTGLRVTNGPPWDYKCRAILLHNEGDGTFTDSIIADYPDSHYGYFVAASDLNRDGAPDLVLRESVASHVLLNDGSGRAFNKVFEFKPGHYGLVCMDMNDDGFPDLVSGTQTGHGGLIELFINGGAGTNFVKTWQSRIYGSSYDSISTVLSVNLNGDDRPDIAAREIYSGQLITLLGSDSSNTFVQASVTWLGDRTFALAGGNINRDSLTDLATYVGWGRVRVFASRGNGLVTQHWQSPELGQAAFCLALADLDRDGFDDIFVGTFADGVLRTYRNRAGIDFELAWQGALPGDGYTGTVADLNGDDCPDLIAGEKNAIRVFLNRAGIPRIRNVSVTDGVPVLTWTACKGKTYRVQAKARFEEHWSDLDGDVLATGFTAGKPDDEVRAARFYRVTELP